MAKKLILIGLFGLLVIMPWGSKANAGCDPFYLVYYGICIKTPPGVNVGSVCVDSIIQQLRGIGEEAKPAYETYIEISGLTIQWFNKKGNSEPAQSYNFTPSEVVSTTTNNYNLVIKKNGAAKDYTCLTEDEVLEAMEAQGLDTGRNSHSKQWYAEIVLTDGYILNTIFVCAYPNSSGGYTPVGDQELPRKTGCLIQDSIGQDFWAPDGVEPGDDFDYETEIVCDDGPVAEGSCTQTSTTGETNYQWCGETGTVYPVAYGSGVHCAPY